MSYYLLNHLSTPVLILVIVGVPTLVAVPGVFVVDKAFPNLRDLEMDDAVRDVVGLLFGLLLALVIASIVTKQDDAESASTAESTAAAQLALATRALPIDMQIKVERRSVSTFTPSSRTSGRRCGTGDRSARASAALETVYGTFRASGQTANPSCRSSAKRWCNLTKSPPTGVSALN